MQKIFQFLLVLLGIWFLLSACSFAESPISSDLAIPTLVIEEVLPTFSVSPEPSPSSSPIPTSTSKATTTPVPRTVLAFTGVIVPARCVQAGIDQRGNADYLYEEVLPILIGADITIGTYNATMRDQIEYIGCEKSWELVGSPANADALQRAGFDVMSVATNHIKDCGKISCGDNAFFDTLYHLDRVGILAVGAGQNLKEAKTPVVVEVNGVRFGFVSLGEVNERVFADAVTPGIAVLSLNNLVDAISEARQVSDVVIVLPHSGPEDYPEVTPQQKYWARHSVEAGANLVVASHAHILQGYQILDGVPVFFSLGNFVFDQVWARDHQQGAILLVTFEGEKIIGFDFIPTIVDQDGTVHYAEGKEREEILLRIEELSNQLLEED